MGGAPGQERSDSELISRSLGEPSEFTHIFERHFQSIHRYLQRATSQSAADDLSSEVFIAAFKSRARYDQRYEDARPWLFGIAANTVRHHLRSDRRRKRLVEKASSFVQADASADPAQIVVEEVVDTGRLDEVLKGIDPRFREVLLLDAGPELSDEEMARALSIPVGTVKSRLARGRRQLRERLAPRGQEVTERTKEVRP